MKFYLTQEAVEKNITPLTQPATGDAGYDLRSVFDVNINPNSQKTIHTGVHLAVPSGHVGIIKDRSSMALQRISVQGGVIDSSYRGEIKVILENHSEDTFSIAPNQKIAQLIIVPCFSSKLDLVDDIEDLGLTDRGASGFGSTGTH